MKESEVCLIIGDDDMVQYISPEINQDRKRFLIIRKENMSSNKKTRNHA